MRATNYWRGRRQKVIYLPPRRRRRSSGCRPPAGKADGARQSGGQESGAENSVKAQPLVRFRTGDIVRFTSEPCACGHSARRMPGAHGRLDDRLIIKGANIFPGDIKAIARKDHDLTGEYRLLVERGDDHPERLTAEIERLAAGPANDAELARRFAGRLKSITGFIANVAILPPTPCPARHAQGQTHQGQMAACVELKRKRRVPC